MCHFKEIDFLLKNILLYIFFWGGVWGPKMVLQLIPNCSEEGPMMPPCGGPWFRHERSHPDHPPPDHLRDRTLERSKPLHRHPDHPPPEHIRDRTRERSKPAHGHPGHPPPEHDITLERSKPAHPHPDRPLPPWRRNRPIV